MLHEDYLYARISEDELALEKGVTRQLRDCRDLSARRSGRVVAEYSDNDISATEAPPRPDFDRLMAAVTAPNPLGVKRRIVIVHTSRLWRNRVERAIGIDLLGRHKLTILQLNGPELDLSTASGRMVAGMIGETDTGESETKAERIRDAARERAEEGRPNGMVLYGWTRNYTYDNRGRRIAAEDVENTEEADIVREIVDRLLAGEPLLAVTQDLNARGVPAPGAGWNRAHRAKGQAADGSRWGKTAVKKLAIRPANVALRVWHRGLPDEALLPAAWPKIVNPDKHDRVVALLTDPDRRRERPGSRQHLLTWGIGECGVCEAHLRATWKGNAKWGVKQLLYACEANGCVGRNKEAVDRMTDTHMVALLQRPDVVELLAGDSSKAAELLGKAEALRARLAAAASDYAEGEITGEQMRIINAKLKPKIESLEAEAKQYQVSPHLDLVVETIGEKARERWESYSVTQKRAIMEAFGVRVIILPTRRGPGFDPSSVRIVPRQRDGEG